jgi:M6 family metalloprotease-like protein
MIEDAVTAAKNAGLDFGPFDVNQDGNVDGLFVIHAGQGGETTSNRNDIWSHAGNTTSLIDTGSKNSSGKPVSVFKYTTEPEYRSTPGDMTIGVFAHEYGHTRWGLPDLYDTDYSSNGIGNWSLMSGGSWNGTPAGSSPSHLDAWSKYYVGFATPTIVTSALVNQKIRQAETSADIFQLFNGTTQASHTEYFLVENRQRSGFDTGLPSSGLLIWHIDAGQSTNTNENYPGCSGCSGHYKVQLVQADNHWDMERKANSGDAGDPYPGTCGIWPFQGNCNTSFTNATSPNSQLWSGSPSGVQVRNISASLLSGLT